MKIEKLKKLKNGKYKLELDDGSSIITYDNIIINNMLFNGKELTNKILSEISIDNTYFDIYYKVVKMISTRWRSEKEIIDYLNKNEVDSKIQTKVLNELNKNGLINDLRYATSYANDAVSLRKNGPYKITADLKALGIKEEIIDEVVSKLDYSIIEENLENIIKKKSNMNKTKSLFQLRVKLYNDLTRLGYETSIINIKLNMLLKENKDVYQKEYEKLYKKYSKKYSGDEIKYRVKQALYQKGFHYNEE